MSQAFSEEFSQHVLQASTLLKMDLPTYKVSLSLTHKFCIRVKGTSQPSTSYQHSHTCHTHTSYLSNSKTLTTLLNTRIYHLADHSKGGCLNRRKSLHQRWKRELIPKEGSTIDKTTTSGKEGWHKLCQQPGLESSKGQLLEQICPIWIIAGI